MSTAMLTSQDGSGNGGLEIVTGSYNKVANVNLTQEIDFGKTPRFFSIMGGGLSATLSDPREEESVSLSGGFGTITAKSYGVYLRYTGVAATRISYFAIL